MHSLRHHSDGTRLRTTAGRTLLHVLYRTGFCTGFPAPGLVVVCDFTWVPLPAHSRQYDLHVLVGEPGIPQSRQTYADRHTPPVSRCCRPCRATLCFWAQNVKRVWRAAPPNAPNSNAAIPRAAVVLGIGCRAMGVQSPPSRKVIHITRTVRLGQSRARSAMWHDDGPARRCSCPALLQASAASYRYASRGGAAPTGHTSAASSRTAPGPGTTPLWTTMTLLWEAASDRPNERSPII